LGKEVEKRKPNLIGTTAPPIEMLMALPPDHFKAAMLDTAIKNDLHAGISINDFRKSLKGKFTAILFWDITCSHCRKTIQELYTEYEKLKDKGLTVITVMTVNTKEAKGKWIDFVNEHQMFGWTNAWSPYSVKFRTAYDISSTPLLFLLNEDEEIIGKRLSPEQLELFLR
jgi:thiol-disulfide isomerase/thioredoxin